jgi:dolichol-phosphate mannosyltransferase
MKSKNSVIIPTFNEEPNIIPLIKGITAQKKEFNIIFVDDNSKDKTRELIEKSMKKNKKIHLIKRKKKMGIGSAYIAGMKYAINTLKSELIFTMDADLSHNPNDLPKFFKKLNEDADVVIGSRYVKGGKIIGWSLFRKMMSKTANFTAKIVLGLKASDVTTGFRCYKIKVLKEINYEKINSNGYSVLQEFLYLTSRKKFIIKEFPLILTDRIAGESKISKKEILKFIINLFTLKIKTITGEIK